MKSHANAFKIQQWMLLNGEGFDASVADMAANCGVTPRDASDAMSYAGRHDVIRVVEGSPKNRQRYVVTGKSLPPAKEPASFEPLLQAWGLRVVDIPCISKRVQECTEWRR